MSTSAPLVFIASPVSHADKVIVAQRVDAAARFAAWVLDEERKNVYPAAVVDTALNQYQKTKNTIEWWMANMKIFMQPAEACYVLCLEGWETSSGVAAEVKVALEYQKPVYHYRATATGFERFSNAN